MEYLTIVAVDMHSSDSTSRTFNCEDSQELKADIEAWEKEIPYSRYELATQELIENEGVENVLEALDIEY